MAGRVNWLPWQHVCPLTVLRDGVKPPHIVVRVLDQMEPDRRPRREFDTASTAISAEVVTRGRGR